MAPLRTLGAPEITAGVRNDLPDKPVELQLHRVTFCESIMSRLNLASLVLLPGLLWASVAASAQPQIRIERNQDAIQINASLRVDAHHHIAWQVLTDYNNLARFVPGMQTSQIVSGPGEPLLLKQTGQSGFLLFSLPIEVLVQIAEVPLEAIRFHGVGGSFRNKHGEWRIERQDDSTLLIYQANFVPGFWVPPLIGPAVMGQDVRSKLLALAQEMQRRAASAVSGASGQAVQR